jgi:hypothetical protein
MISLKISYVKRNIAVKTKKIINENLYKPKIKEAFTVKLKMISINHYSQLHQINRALVTAEIKLVILYENNKIQNKSRRHYLFFSIFFFSH